MGGYGSGRRAEHTTVEECRWLDVNRWMREGIIQASLHTYGSWVWKDAITGEKTSSIGYEAKTWAASGWVRLWYEFKSGRNEGEDVDYKVSLVTTRPHFGGLRWWFICPLVVDDTPCRRRVGKLYLPPGGVYYGCRHCYDLTYESCQESHRWDSIGKKLGLTDEEWNAIRRLRF